MAVNILTVAFLLFFGALVTYCEPQQQKQFVQRLPNSVYPLNYRLTVLPVISLERDERLCGHVFIDLEVNQPTRSIVLHAANLTILRVVVNEQSSSESDEENALRSVEALCFSGIIQPDNVEEEDNMVESFHLNGTSELLTIQLNEEMLHPEDEYRLAILFTAQVNEQADRGFFRKRYSGNENDCCQR